MSRGPSEVRRVDADGVVRVDRGRGRWWIPAVAAVLGAVAIALAWILSAPEQGSLAELLPADNVDTGSRPSPTSAPHGAPARARSSAVRAVPPGGSTDPDQEAFPNMATDTPPPEGPSGIALFPARGTKPIKRGIVVPDDFPLPPGYVRHYQYSEDGQMLPAILMFHPDHHPVDAQGRPVPMPADRVVPLELAPPGLPIQMLEPPEPAEQGGEGR